MTDLFGISKAEALARLNRRWAGKDFSDDSMIYHEDEDFWAKTLYYKIGTRWWLSSEKLEPEDLSVEPKISFTFKVDDHSATFCEAIISRMMELFGISRANAFTRMNRRWKGIDMIGDHIHYNEDEDFWAKELYKSGTAELFKR